MFTTFTLDSGKKIKVALTGIVSIEETSKDGILEVHLTDGANYNIQADMEKVDEQILKDVYGNVLNQVKSMMGSMMPELGDFSGGAEMDPEFLKNLGIDDKDVGNA